jgi:hypothetical protein
LFPDAPQFRESPFSSSRMSLRSPTTIFSTPSSTHRSTMCLLRVWKKWSLRRDFLLTDQEAVEQAVQNGAIRFTDTDLGNPF